MVVGIGTDIVKIDRIGKSLDRLGERFAQRILTSSELEEYRAAKKPVAFLARRFAVKEAAAKALGTGIGEGVSWQHFCIEHDPLGAPVLRLSGRAEEVALQKQAAQYHVSLSDEHDYVVAFVVLSSRS